MRRRFIPGLNVQTPWARLLICGKKTVETRFYPLPTKYVGKEMAIVETPGKTGAFRSHIIGIVVFGESFLYQNRKQFQSDGGRHLVPPKSKFGWNDARGKKWGWPLLHVHALVTPKPCVGRGGVVYWRRVAVPGK